MGRKEHPGINFLEKQQEKLPYIYKQHSSNLPFQRERNLNNLIKEIPSMNKSSQEQRKGLNSGILREVKSKKNRNERELTGLRDNKRKESLHIHKSFSFK